MTLAMPGGDRVMPEAAQYTTQMFAKYGVCTHVVVVPPKRATKMLLAGELDGEVARVAEYGRQIGDVAVKVPTPVAMYETFLVTSNPAVTSLDQIDRPNVSIGTVRGWVWMNTLAQQLKHADVRTVDSQTTLIEMLDKGRLDAILLGGDVMRQNRLDQRYSVVRSGQFALYVWLRKEKADMVEAVDRAIGAYIKQNGLIPVRGSMYTSRAY